MHVQTNVPLTLLKFLMNLGEAYVGEFLYPGKDCSDILNKELDADDGFYWITLGVNTKRKVSICKIVLVSKQLTSIRATINQRELLRERTSAVKHQNWDSAPLHKLIKNFPLFARPLA
jgi:hypothetical protein